MVHRPAAPTAGEAEFWAGVANAQRFFMGTAEVQFALQKLTSVVDAAGIPYAIAGAMALNHHGYRRVTVNVDVLLTRDGLDHAAVPLVDLRRPISDRDSIDSPHSRRLGATAVSTRDRPRACD